MRALGLLFLSVLGCATPELDLPSSAPPQVATEQLIHIARKALVSAEVDHLRWGFTPFLGTDNESEAWAPVFQVLSERLGVPIELVHLAGYAEAEQRIVEGDIDVGTMSPYGYVQARRLSPGIRVFASHVARGTPTYGVYIVTREDSGVRSLKDLVGKPFGYVDRRSTSGWLFPAARMLEEGIDPKRDVEPLFLGTHGAVFDAVATGKVAAGGVYDHALTSQRGLHPLGHKVTVLAKAPRVPFDAYALRAGLPFEVGEALAALLGEISTQSAEGRRLLRDTPSVNGFFPVDDDHYEILRTVEQAVEQGLRGG